VGNPIE